MTGGDIQPQTQAFFLYNLIVQGMNPQEAADAARILLFHGANPRGKPALHEVGGLFSEAGLCESVVEELKRRGHQFRHETPAAVGEIAGIMKSLESDVLYAFVDKRRDGQALAI